MSQTHSVAKSDFNADQDLREEVQELMSRKKLASEAYDNLGKLLEERGKLLETLFKAHSTLFSEAALALTQLRQQVACIAEEHVRQSGADPLDDLEEDLLGPEGKSDNKRSGDAKKLFKIIAKSCHPDKTTNRYLVSLFSLAKEARDTGDSDALKDILLEVDMHLADGKEEKVIPDLINRLLDRRSLLAKQISTLNLKSSQLIRTPMGKVYSMTESDDRNTQEQGKALFKSFLLTRSQELDEMANTLRHRILAEGHEPCS